MITKQTSLFRSVLVSAVLAGVAGIATAQTQKAPADNSAKDRQAMESAFARADSNGDGKLTREEAARMPEIAARFDELDKNKDGVLSMEEFSAVAAMPAK